jgi:hypothetical protein
MMAARCVALCGTAKPWLSGEIRALGLTAQEQAGLGDFLRADG